MKVAVIDPSGFTPPYNHHLCQALGKQDCTVRLITSGSTQWKPDSYERISLFYEFSSQITNPPRLRLGIKAIEHASDMAKLPIYLRKWNPDIIHFQWLPVPPFDQFIIPLFRRIAPTVLTVHDSTPFHGESSSRIQLLSARSSRDRFDHLVAHTESTAKDLIDQGHPSNKISVIPHGILRYSDVVTDDYAPTIQETNRRYRVLFFGTLKEYKGVDTLIRALAQLPSNMLSETEIYVAGAPQMSVSNLRSLAKELGVDDAIMWDLRYIPYEDVPLLFQSSDVLVLPYKRIDQSGVLMTALGFNIPIIATRVGGFPEVLSDGQHGRLISSENPAALAVALTEVLQDDDKRASMGEATQELAQTTYSWSRIATMTIDLYKQV